MIRMNELTGIVGFKAWNVYRLIREGDFPPPVKIGGRAVAWRESDIVSWIESREVTQQ